MATDTAVHQIATAWQCFAAGNLDDALSLARDAYAASPMHRKVCAALGFFLIQAGLLDDAAAVLQPAIENDPEYAPLHWYNGYLRSRQGDVAGAALAFQCACELDPGLDEAAFALAWALHDLGRTKEALPWASHALTLMRTPARLMQMGWLQQVLGNLELAVQAYREAIAGFDPQAAEQPRLRLHLSQCLVRLGQSAEAALLLRDAVKQWPDNAELRTEAAWREHAQGHFPYALQLARDLVRDHPHRAESWHLLGVLHQDSGDLKAADQAFLEAHQRDLGLTDALVRRARIQREFKQFEGAKWLLGLALQHRANDDAAQDQLAQILLDLQETDEARRLLHRRLRVRPDSADLWRLLAVGQLRKQRPQAAARALRKALSLEPGSVEAQRMLGWLSLEEGELVQAVSIVRHLVARLPHDTAAQVQAAFVLSRAGHLAEAEHWAQKAVAQAPALAEAWRALSHVRLRQGWLSEAEFAVQQALQLVPGQPDSLRHLGWVLLASARLGEAQLAFLRAIEAVPGDPVPKLELGEAQRRAGQFTVALQGVNALLAARPTWQPALLLRARLMVEGGVDGAADTCAQLLRSDVRNADAVKVCLRLTGLGNPRARRLLSMAALDVLRTVWRDAIVEASHTQGQAYLAMLIRAASEDMDTDPWIATAALYANALSPQSTAVGLAVQARDWYRGLKVRSGLAPFAAAPLHRRSDERPRIAYVASQLHQSLLRRVLAAHTADQAQVFLYTCHPFYGLPSHIHLLPLVPETLAESCAANRIDVVIDVGGLHPFEGQFGLLEAYARRLAPVQLGWLGCWGSTGGLFDGLLADDAAIPPQHAVGYEEPVFPLRGGQWCWDPPLAAPDTRPPPSLTHGGTTYGVTARSLKLSEPCLDAFARVVARTPMSTIRFIGRVADDWPLRRQVLACMHAHGVGTGRVFFDPFRPHAAYLEWFGRVDVVLDSFPFNGGLSLLDPLWMGVPVVTLAGSWAGARQGASVLAALGLTGWVAENEQGFCDTAIAIANNRGALSAHRAALRSRIRGSALLDGRRVASQIEQICAQLTRASTAIAFAADAKTRTRAHAQWALDGWLSQPRCISLPTPASDATPDLSVVVVLFNQAGLSRRTLQALADQQGVRFETIVVDNASSDRTPQLLNQLQGARIVRNTANLGFLRAANQGAELATGRYLAFLNSDAILQEGALAAALQAIQADCRIGALGGRVVLTDGGLQEAGNVIFCDGSAAGIGRAEDPFGYAARAARSTDYVSGVFLLTPVPLWRRLGGFDEAFAPAYYEDTDYCVRVWQTGMRVVYEPAVLLEHLEWGSATGESATHLMQHNRELFCERHSAWLQDQPRPAAQPLDADPWRSPEDHPRRPRVLFVDNEVPHMFKGGGLPRARLMLQALRDWPVTLFPLWALHDDWRAVYASLPGSVEVALGHGMAGLEAFLERRLGVYDVLLVSRPPNLQALQPLRTRRPELFAGMRLVYDAEALFAMRDIAMAEVQGRPLPVATAQARIDCEVALAADASDVLVVSDGDARHFQAAGHRTHILSHGIAVRRGVPGLSRRSGLLFIGALHPGTPNEDGLLWFIREVLPLLRQNTPIAPKLSVVGVCLSDKVAAFAGPDITVLGPQDSLEPHYDAARVFVAPVRFAGGVPAKVIEAAANGLPTVASALLVQQLGWRDGLDIVGARDALTFASGITRLLDDDVAWQNQQHAAWQQCAQRYDPELFGRALRAVLNATDAGGSKAQRP